MIDLPAVLKPPFERGAGHCWKAQLPPEMVWVCDNNQHPRRSPLLLWEDDRSLGPMHSPHADIELHGEGRHSFWSGTVYFSTSDNSNPNETGRVYRIVLRQQRNDDIFTINRPEPPLVAWKGQ